MVLQIGKIFLKKSNKVKQMSYKVCFTWLGNKHQETYNKEFFPNKNVSKFSTGM